MNFNHLLIYLILSLAWKITNQLKLCKSEAISKIKESNRKGEFKNFYMNPYDAEKVEKLQKWFELYNEMESFRLGGDEGVYCEAFLKKPRFKNSIIYNY